MQRLQLKYCSFYPPPSGCTRTRTHTQCTMGGSTQVSGCTRTPWEPQWDTPPWMMAKCMLRLHTICTALETPQMVK
jgi:hypothetical protein